MKFVCGRCMNLAHAHPMRPRASNGNPGGMTYTNPDPDPARTTGLEPGGGVPPGETPPAESSMPEAGPQDIRHQPNTGWAKGPLIAILLVVVLFVIGFAAYAASVLR